MEVDTKSMRAMTEAFPKLLGRFEPSAEILEELRRHDSSNVEGICIVGMGGSAIAGSLCASYFSRRSTIPILCVQDYELPNWVNSRWFVIAISYSGNTEETINAAKIAIDRGCQVVAITSGGVLQGLIDSNKVCIVPTGFQPRAALPILFTILLRLLESLMMMKETDMDKISERLVALKSGWEGAPDSPSMLAKQLIERVPLFIGTQYTGTIAYRGKCQINENAKYSAIWSILPEANHNEIESVQHMSRVGILPIFLRSNSESKQLAKRIEVTSTIYLERFGSCNHIRVNAHSELEETLGLVYYVDLLSVELAQLLGVDPLPVETITRLKRMLSD